MGSYSVILTCRNSEETIVSTLNSLNEQSVKPEYIIIIDDGSKDKTPNILKDFKLRSNNLHIITNPDMGYNIGRVVQNWNKAIRLAKEFKLKAVDYHMISADDTIYEKDYCKKIIRCMDFDHSLVIASGNYDNNNYATPHGAGRLVRNSFFNLFYEFYPERMGYESVMFYYAIEHNFKYRIIKDATFVHTRKLGSNHNFYEFGASMRTLGYHPILALGRCLIYFVSGQPIGRLGSLSMLYHYMTYKPKTEGYDSIFDNTTREVVRRIQKKKIRGLINKKKRIFMYNT
ncbi:MAG TPA: glycosyltransferase family A protein [Nitrososphaeraceae archaeon]|nr:glycosyltransferase family A protein [Nitrososphaeraceae archaeon]